jgi:hypothetical protein
MSNDVDISSGAPTGTLGESIYGSIVAPSLKYINGEPGIVVISRVAAIPPIAGTKTAVG